MASQSEAGVTTSTAKIDFTKKIDASSLKGQSILVTGGTTGIGGALVESLAAAGAYVTVIARQAERGQAFVERQTQKGYKVQFHQGDVRSWEDQVAAFEAAVAFAPSRSLDIVIPNAGMAGHVFQAWLNEHSGVDDSSQLVKPDTRTLDINLIGVWYSIHLAMHHFRRTLRTGCSQAQSKQIVFIGSLAGYATSPLRTDYAACKFGLRGMWKAIRDEPGLLGEDTKVQFRSSLIAPWFVQTARNAHLKPKLDQLNIAMADESECVDVLLRIVCDEEVKSRAIAVAPAGKSFDLCDDFEGFDAGRELQSHLLDGTLGMNYDQFQQLLKLRRGL